MVMETKFFIRFFLLLSVSGLLIFSSCVKEGPMGLAGIDGVDGMDGKDGKDGVDGTASCASCHNKTKKALVTMQSSQSAHGLMPTLQTRENCVACHSSEGFIESLTNVETKTFTALTNPSALSCETCHTTHQTFDFQNDGPDYALRTTAKVPMFVNKNIVLDMGNSNLCVNCHQPRAAAPVGNAEGNFVVSNFRYGPHYGNQSVVLEGLWGYHHPQGSTTIPAAGSHAHRQNASCTSCHMHDSSSGNVGGHSWNVGPEACSSCHSTINSMAAITASKAAYYELFNELGDKLVEKGALEVNASGGLQPVAGTYPIDVAGALFNYRLLYGDHSGGIHNPAYAKALLQNSIEALN
jgi:hypothetical protein